MNAWTTLTPAGPLAVLVDDDGAVTGCGWTTVGDLADQVGTSSPTTRSELGDVSRAVAAYLGGDLAAVDAVPVRQAGGEFTVQAWNVLRQVRPGAPISYTELAARAGRPAAVRAAASACGSNRAALFVPCHRVLRTDGTLGGFRWGLEVKRWLLDHEGAALPG